MTCPCIDNHPFILLGTFLGDNCVGLTGWGWVFYFGSILGGGGIMLTIATIASAWGRNL